MTRLRTALLPALRERGRRLAAFLDRHGVYTLLWLAPLLNLLLEALSRRSVAGPFVQLWENPYFFALNCIVIFLTLLPSLFVRRRHFARLLAAVLWLALGVTNWVLMGYRASPLTAADIRTLPSVWTITLVYMSVWELLLIAAALGLLIFLMVLAFRRLRRCERELRRSTLTAGFALGIAAAMVFIGSQLRILPRTAPDLLQAYEDYGFVWSFGMTAASSGVGQPEDYSETLLQELAAEKGEEEDFAAGERVNLVFVQLESFFDPAYLKDVRCSENPVRSFSVLKDACPSGFLTVPVVGGGTVNTEFEVLTGMSLDYFGAGEVPFNTVLKTETCESLPYDLAERGYRSHAIHNHTGNFYERNEVYANLGFDSFTSVEYMNGVERNALGWAKDSILTGEILKALRSDPEPDFIHAVSVQPHGRYPSAPEEGTEYAVTVSGLEREDLTNEYDYYVNELRQTDAFVGELVQALAEFEEPVLLVLYGDHLPALEITEEQLKNGSVYETEYVIWSNYGLRGYNKDLMAYQLGAEALRLLGYEGGVLTKLHQSREEMDEASYQRRLELAEYDMLYGERSVWGGENPYAPTDLVMGTEPIVLTGWETKGEVLLITGERFTPCSKVLFNGQRLDSRFFDEHTLLLTQPLREEGALCVAQFTDSGAELSRTEELAFTGETSNKK